MDKTPKELSDDDYNSFYRELYPNQFETPLFNSTQLKFELNSMKPNKIQPNSIKCV